MRKFDRGMRKISSAERWLAKNWDKDDIHIRTLWVAKRYKWKTSYMKEVMFTRATYIGPSHTYEDDY